MAPSWNWSPLVRKLAAFCVVLMIACAGLVIALVAVSRSNSTADCVNNVLAARGGPTTRETDALKEFADSLEAFVTTPPEMKKAAGEALVAEFHRFQDELAAVQRARAAHPFGHC